MIPSFVTAFEMQAKKCVVSEPEFSRGTYRFEVIEGKKKYYPFLQLNEAGECTDSFCTCKVSEVGSGCPHLAAAYLQIQDGPWHVRFQKSFWYQLFFSAAVHFHFKKGGVLTGKNRRLKELLGEREKETEENSIKFSNLSLEELSKYRAGNPSLALQFELSFWSDIAKWLFYLSAKESYTVTFTGSPPDSVAISFPDVKIELPVIDLLDLIPTLSTVKSNLNVFENIKSTRYENGTLYIEHENPSLEGLAVGDYIFVKDKGFYRKGFGKSEVKGAEIAEAIPLLNIPVVEEEAHYSLFFDEEKRLHIRLDVEDLFAPYAYKGHFVKLSHLEFDEKETIIEHVAEFVSRHRHFLQNYPGFQTHVGSLESHLTYKMGDKLTFDAELAVAPEEDMIHFDEWVYIKGQGFYMKKAAGSRLPVRPGMEVALKDISSFIDNHKDELESVTGFFSEKPLITKLGLKVALEEGVITVSPDMQYGAATPQTMRRFGNYVYAEGLGFSPVPTEGRDVPERYSEKVTIAPSNEIAFLVFELETLKPHITELDPRLQKPHDLVLRVDKIAPGRKKRGQQWLLDMKYASDHGMIDLFTLHHALQEKKRFLFSEAGLIDLKEPRFFWIAGLQKKKLEVERGLLRLNTLEWIRLTLSEKIDPPKDKESLGYLRELQNFELIRPFDLSLLKSQLRPYQEQGLQWLWFLYCHGLSGLLCDDMGLGKTHQAMALLSAIVQEDPEKANKYLVVCPTSVIYHWQELLKRFFPGLRIYTHYGLERSLDKFEEEYDLVLTSYGILRANKNDFKPFHFEVAIFDEIQIAKNHTSQTHKALRKISAEMRLGLTGTPIENRLRELKALLDVVIPSYMPPDSLFRELYTNPIEKFQDETAKQELSRIVKPFILRRKKSEVLTDLPEKIEEVAYSDLSNEQKALYKETAYHLRDTVYQDLKDPNKNVPFVHIFSALATLKRICDHPALVLDDVKNFSKHESGKWDLFVELLDEARESGQKVVVFSQYLEMLAIMEAHLKKKNIGYASIKGSTRDRPEQLKKFREDPNCEVFLASLLAAGVGIDLTCASIVIHYDRWWNPAKENQATDRVHRIGQNRGVQVFKLITKHTIEEHIHALIEKKKHLIEDILTSEDQITYLSRDELIQVFETMLKELE